MKIAISVCALLATSLQSAVIYSGSFGSDDEVQFFHATLTAPGTLAARSLGYGGDSASLVAPGGFDTVLSLFDTSTGVLLALNNDGNCPPSAPHLGNCWDAELSIGLGPGSYVLALTQYDNMATGPTLADGFSRAGQGNFTPFLSGFPGTSFVDAAGNQRSNEWAILIEGADSVSAVPEPGTFWTIGLATAALLGARQRRP